MKTNEQLAKMRSTGNSQPVSVENSADFAALQEKFDKLQEDLTLEKKQALKLETDFDKYKQKMVKQEEEWNTATKELAKLEMENDELKNDVRQMGYMVQDLE